MIGQGVRDTVCVWEGCCCSNSGVQYLVWPSDGPVLRLSWDECASFLGMLQVVCFAGAYVGLWWLAEEEVISGSHRSDGAAIR
jgi:hypothetical protein